MFHVKKKNKLQDKKYTFYTKKKKIHSSLFKFFSLFIKTKVDAIANAGSRCQVFFDGARDLRGEVSDSLIF